MPGWRAALPSRRTAVVGAATGTDESAPSGRGGEQGVNVFFDVGGALPDGGTLPAAHPEELRTSNLPPVPPVEAGPVPEYRGYRG